MGQLEDIYAKMAVLESEVTDVKAENIALKNENACAKFSLVQGACVMSPRADSLASELRFTASATPP